MCRSWEKKHEVKTAAVVLLEGLGVGGGVCPAPGLAVMLVGAPEFNTEVSSWCQTFLSCVQ